MCHEFGLDCEILFQGRPTTVEYTFTAATNPSNNTIRLIAVGGIANPYESFNPDALSKIKSLVAVEVKSARQELQVSVLNDLK